MVAWKSLYFYPDIFFTNYVMYLRYNTKIRFIFFEITQDFQAESLISIKRLLNFHKHGSFFGYASQPAPDCNRLIIKT